MDRKEEACLARAAACRARAETDPANRDRWMNEAIDWLERAAKSMGRVAVTIESRDDPLTPKNPN